MEFFINNCIISKHNNITKITPIALYKNDINNLINFTAGNRMADNDILHKLADGELEYENIINFNQSDNLTEMLVLHNIRYI